MARANTIKTATLGEALVKIIFYMALIVIGAFCVNYDLRVLLHHTIPFAWALVVNIFSGSASITLAIILKILSFLGVIAA